MGRRKSEDESDGDGDEHQQGYADIKPMSREYIEVLKECEARSARDAAKNHREDPAARCTALV